MLNSRENNGFFLFYFHDISFISASDVLECKNVVCAWMYEGPKSMNFCRCSSTFAVNASEANANLVIEEILTRETQYKQIAPSNDTSQKRTRTQRIMKKKKPNKCTLSSTQSAMPRQTECKSAKKHKLNYR